MHIMVHVFIVNGIFRGTQSVDPSYIVHHPTSLRRDAQNLSADLLAVFCVIKPSINVENFWFLVTFVYIEYTEPLRD